ncbi:hypothetical protein ACHAWF_012517 [Thalassiosira exigua]
MLEVSKIELRKDLMPTSVMSLLCKLSDRRFVFRFSAVAIKVASLSSRWLSQRKRSFRQGLDAR